MKETNFKPSPLGPIPHDWEVIPLGNLGEVQMCKRIFSNQTSETGEIPFFKIGTLGKAPDAFISRELYENYKKLYNFPLIGELLISAAGTIGRIHKYDGADCYYQDSNIVWLRNDERQVSNRYLAQTFKIIKWQSQDGGTISRLYNSNFRATLCCYPTSLQEQERIAGALSDVDELIATTEALLQKKRDIKQGTMQQLLSGKRRLPGFSATWGKTPLYRIGEIQMCKRIFSFQTSEFGEIPFFKIGTLGKEPDAFISRALFENYRNKYNYPIKGEILISAAGTIGRTIKYEGQDCYYQDSNIVWLRNSGTIVSNSFLSHAFKVIKWQSQDGGTISRLYNANFRATTCYHPSDITEQQAIVEVLNDMDKEIKAIEDNLKKYKAIREAMMQQLLTGKIRLI